MILGKSKEIQWLDDVFNLTQQAGVRIDSDLLNNGNSVRLKCTKKNCRSVVFIVECHYGRAKSMWWHLEVKIPISKVRTFLEAKNIALELINATGAEKSKIVGSGNGGDRHLTVIVSNQVTRLWGGVTWDDVMQNLSQVTSYKFAQYLAAVAVSMINVGQEIANSV